MKLHASKIALLKVKMRIAEFLIKADSIGSSVDQKLFEPERLCQFFDKIHQNCSVTLPLKMRSDRHKAHNCFPLWPRIKAHGTNRLFKIL